VAHDTRLASAGPPRPRGEINWRASRQRLEADKYQQLRRIRWERGDWSQSDDELREQARREAERAVIFAIGQQSAEGWA
jgi:hypothetical protein